MEVVGTREQSPVLRQNTIMMHSPQKQPPKDRSLGPSSMPRSLARDVIELVEPFWAYRCIQKILSYGRGRIYSLFSLQVNVGREVPPLLEIRPVACSSTGAARFGGSESGVEERFSGGILKDRAKEEEKPASVR